jgi:hypothetical protein
MYVETCMNLWKYLAHFFLAWQMFQTNFAEKIKTHILCSVTIFGQSCRLWDNVKNTVKARLATDDNMAHAHCILDTYVFKHTLRISNSYFFYSATMVTLKRPSVAFIHTYIHCLCCHSFANCPPSQLSTTYISLSTCCTWRKAVLVTVGTETVSVYFVSCLSETKHRYDGIYIRVLYSLFCVQWSLLLLS